MPPGKPTPLSTKNSKRQPSKPKPQDDGLDVAMSTRVDWKDNTLTWSIITAIEDDEKIRSGLFPGPGKTPSTANGGGKAKTDWYYQIAEKTFKDHEEYSEPFAKATSAKAKAKWSEKIKNRLDKLSKLTIEHIRTLDKTGEGIQCEADIWECDNQFVNKWREVKASFPWFFEMRDLVGSRPNRINDHLLGNSGTIGTTIPDFDTEDPSSVDDDIDTYSDVLRDETDIKSDVDVSDPPLATATPSLKRKVKSEDMSPSVVEDRARKPKKRSKFEELVSAEEETRQLDASVRLERARADREHHIAKAQVRKAEYEHRTVKVKSAETITVAKMEHEARMRELDIKLEIERMKAMNTRGVPSRSPSWFSTPPPFASSSNYTLDSTPEPFQDYDLMNSFMTSGNNDVV